MSKLKIVAFDDFEKVPSISYLGFGVGKEVYELAVVIPSEDPNFDIEDRMLSLAVQIKIKIQKSNIDIKDKEAVYAAIKSVAARDTEFKVVPVRSLTKMSSDYIGLYTLDLNRVVIHNVRTSHRIIREIGDPYKISSIIDGLLKLAKG